MNEATSLLRRLECANPNCQCHRTTAKGRGLTHCPAHNDRTPSLNVTPLTDKLLIHCFAGCPQTKVLLACRER